MGTDSRAARLRNSLICGLGYVATTWCCRWLLEHPLADALVWARALVALLPVIPAVLLIRTMVRATLAGDELQQRIDLEAIAFASLAVGIASLTFALLTVADAILVSGQTVLVWILPALAVLYILARLRIAARYR